jgi:hypothetical protein
MHHEDQEMRLMKVVFYDKRQRSVDKNEKSDQEADH